MRTALYICVYFHSKLSAELQHEPNGPEIKEKGTWTVCMDTTFYS